MDNTICNLSFVSRITSWWVDIINLREIINLNFIRNLVGKANLSILQLWFCSGFFLFLDLVQNAQWNTTGTSNDFFSGLNLVTTFRHCFIRNWKVGVTPHESSFYWIEWPYIFMILAITSVQYSLLRVFTLSTSVSRCVAFSQMIGA